MTFNFKLYGPFLWMGFNCLKAIATLRRQFTFFHSVPRNSWYSFYRPQKDERLNQSWSHPVILNMGPLDWESSVLTTRPTIFTTSFKIIFAILCHRQVKQTNTDGNAVQAIQNTEVACNNLILYKSTT